ncbi:peptidoglycan recognition protein family protein [Nocardiopsis synnemataformans]|uniref:peptidoglycan recognition protein family protein n=1 Tax=Nocardiopsis synnemataformans TaxID=61305 RepID=UPI003EC0565A
MKFESRSAVGLPSVSGVSTNITPRSGGTTIHYVGGAVGIPASAPHSRCRAKIREIHRFHTRGRGWAFFAYSLAVCQHGIVMEGRGKGRRTAANGTNPGNQRYYAVLGLIGGSERPSAQMIQGIKDTVAYLRSSGGAGSRVNGHRDHLSTSCPGDRLYQLVRDGAFGSGGSGSPVTPGPEGMDSERSFSSQQKAINALGYRPRLAVDGIFGPLTEDGVQWLQRLVGVDADGLWGPRTEAAYRAYLDGDPEPADPRPRLAVDGDFGPATTGALQEATGADIDGDFGPQSKRKLQEHLNDHGAGLEVDGVVGPLTTKALQRHLNKVIGAKLAVDGDWGPKTTRALQKALNAGEF